MEHLDVTTLLPEELLSQVQRYVQGRSLYIPKLKDSYKKWGDNTHGKTITLLRNEEIRASFCDGFTVEELANRYHLSLESIRKIVYRRK